MNLHPDDLLFFTEVSAAMKRVARDYNLPLRSVTHLPMPEQGMADRLGDCNASGDIRLVMRCTVNGVWCDESRDPKEVWKTAAHELSHLRHFHHGPAFHEFQMELETALQNEQVDHRDRLLQKLVKMQNQRDGEAALGNSAAAEAFASAINRMLIEHELNPSDIDYARTLDRDPVIEVQADLNRYNIERVRRRVAWQESLARIVARAHLCTFLIRRKSNSITFVGTRAHATVAEYTFGTLLAAADKMSDDAYKHFWWSVRRETGMAPGARAAGFRASWLTAFITRIDERFEEARRVAVQAADASVPGGTSTALVRLDGALARSKKYVDDKFEGTKIRYAATLRHLSRNNAAGAERGKAAADRMPIGRKAMEGSTRNRLLLT